MRCCRSNALFCVAVFDFAIIYEYERVTTMQLIYVDVLRQIIPGTDVGEFNYFLFGGFDALKVIEDDASLSTRRSGSPNLLKDIQQLKQLHELRHETVSKASDRQPLFLYYKNEYPTQIFDAALETQPLVLTLFQIDKTQIEYTEVDSMIEVFDFQIENTRKALGIAESEIKYDVFWNLGESDFVVVFRSNTLSVTGKLLYALRCGGIVENEVCILSTCSHFAFPNSKERLLENLKMWLRSECSVDSNTEILSLFNTCSRYNNIELIKTGDDYALDGFLFGEWDYRALHKIEGELQLADGEKVSNIDETARFLFEDVFSNILQNGDRTKPTKSSSAYRTSYSVPIVKLSKDEIGKGKAALFIPCDMDDGEWIEDLNTSFSKLTKSVKVLNEVYDENCSKVVEIVISFGRTTIGLAKYLFRLNVARFEQDLYIYVKRVFLFLARITEENAQKLEYLHNGYNDESVEAIKSVYAKQSELVLEEYIKDTTTLISSMQHLFAVLSISPHTFLETYGTSMRSMVAACKLVVAYQGIARYLDKAFPEKLIMDEDILPKHDFLILPYRKAASNNSLLYSFGSPKSRLSLIEIDYSSMFKIKATLFMLLHECAHTLGDRHRWTRLQYYTCTVIKSILGYNLGEFLQDTDRTFSRPLNECRKKKESERILELPETIRKQLQNDITFWIGKLAYELTEYFIENDYYNYCVAQEEYSNAIELGNAFFEPVCAALKEYIEDHLYTDPELEHFEERRKGLTKYMERILEACKKRAQELESTYAETLDPNLRAAIHLRQRYTACDDIVWEFVKTLRIDAESLVKRGDIEMFANVFRDVYADIFAINLLKLKKEDYIKMIPIFVGANINDMLEGTENIIRLAVVLETCFADKDLCKALSSIHVIKRVLDNASTELARIREQTYINEILLYASYCQDDLRKKIGSLPANEMEGKQILSQMCSEDLKDVVKGIFFFWKYSTMED